MRYLLSALAFSLLTLSNFAQNPEKEKEIIKEMCGCYQVDFEYAETFSEAKDYQFHDRYSAHGLEWIFVDEESEDQIVLQHLLVINDSTVIKHWRQDWLYENQDLLVYQKNLEWENVRLSADDVAGTWTQKVYQVDDSPRYEGHATWITVDGKKYWESQVPAPLPRREFTKRSDYNLMLRTNKHRITEAGHVHELDNAKVIRSEEKDSILVWEKGRNTYTRVADEKCALARDWWKNNQRYWRDVRQVWTDIIGESEYLNLKYKVEDQKLWQKLFALGAQYQSAEDYDPETVRGQIRAAIKPYLSHQPSPWKTTANLD